MKTIEELKAEFLETKQIKYLDYRGNISYDPPEKSNKFKTQEILTVYRPGETEKVL